MRVTASEYGRVDRCPPSAVLAPVLIERPPRASDPDAMDFARRGTVIHKYLLDVLNTGDWEKALADVEEKWKPTCAAIELHTLPATKPDEYAGEVAWAYNWRFGTARELGRGGERDATYAAVDDDSELGGTADLVSLRSDSVDVDDYKTGWRDLGPAANSWQLKLYALMAARCYGRKAARVRFIRILDGRPFFISAEFSEMDLDLIEQQVRQTMLLVEQLTERLKSGDRLEMVAFREGAHCDGCKVFNRCPAKVGLASALATGSLQSLEFNLLGGLSKENGATLWQRIRDVQKVLDVVDAKFKEWINENGVIPFADGKVYGPRESVVETVLPDVARERLVAKYGEDLVDSVEKTETTISMGDLEEASNKWCEQHKGTKKGATWEATRLLLRGKDADGKQVLPPAVKGKSQVTFTRYSPKEKK